MTLTFIEYVQCDSIFKNTGFKIFHKRDNENTKGYHITLRKHNNKINNSNVEDMDNRKTNTSWNTREQQKGKVTIEKMRKRLKKEPGY